MFSYVINDTIYLCELMFGGGSVKRLNDPLFKDNLIHLFPNTKNSELADILGVPLYTLRRMAKKLNLEKSSQFTKLAHQNTILKKLEKQEKNRKAYSPSEIQMNIIIGSLLGDGSLSLYGRSKTAHYREQGCKAQDVYRIWKKEMLTSLDFKFSSRGINGKLSSPSHPIYTDLYHKFYDSSGRKVITEENIKLLNQPIGLACLFMDDGTLTINTSSKTYRKKMYLHPYLCIYSLSFTKEENIILANHINAVYGVKLALKKRPDGYGYILATGKNEEIHKFIEIVEPYVSLVPCMNYKVEIRQKLLEKQQEFQLKHPDREVIVSQQKTPED